MRQMLPVLTAALSAFSVAAQPLEVSGPGSGFVFDSPTKSIRAIQGSLGSAWLSSPIVDDVQFGSISPRGSHAIVCRDLVCSVETDLTAATHGSRVIATLNSSPDGVAWSPDGGTAVLYSRTASWIQIHRGLPAEPQSGPVQSLSSLKGALLSVAVASGGQRVAVAISGEQGGVFEVTPEGGYVPLADTRDGISMAFGQQNDVLYVLNGATNRVEAIDLASHLKRTLETALSNATALQLSGDGRLLFVTGQADEMLVTIDTSSGEIRQQVTLSFAPTGLSPLRDGALLLSSRTSADDVLWSFSPGRGAFFLPAPATDSAQRAQRRR